MAKDLSLQTGIDNSDGDYLRGKLVNGTTVVGEGINQDIVQFFQKLMDDASLLANFSYDNEANGYQFVEALQAKIMTDRGDPAAVDFVIGDLTLDGSYHDLDFSSVAPVGARFLSLNVTLVTSVVSATNSAVLIFREKGNSNDINIAIIQKRTDIGSHDDTISAQLLIPCNSGRVIEYKTLETGSGATTIDIVLSKYIS